MLTSLACAVRAASDSVLESLARALQLDEAERAHLFDLARPASSARFVFLDPRAADFYGDWERTANDLVAILRTEAGRNPYDKGLTDLIGELSTRSEDFRTRWAAHDVRLYRTGSKTLQPQETSP
jgi:hypothetical protein